MQMKSLLSKQDNKIMSLYIGIINLLYHTTTWCHCPYSFLYWVNLSILMPQAIIIQVFKSQELTGAIVYIKHKSLLHITFFL